MKTFRYGYGITLGAATETSSKNTAAQAVVHHGRSASGVDECGELYRNPGRFDQFWTQMAIKAEAINVGGTTSKEQLIFRKLPRPPSSGIV